MRFKKMTIETKKINISDKYTIEEVYYYYEYYENKRCKYPIYKLITKEGKLLGIIKLDVLDWELNLVDRIYIDVLEVNDFIKQLNDTWWRILESDLTDEEIEWDKEFRYNLGENL